jgi:flagellar biogenesis protein FliO
MRLRAAAASLLLALPCYADAAKDLEYHPPTAPAGPDAGQLLGRLAILTAITVVGGVLCLFLARRAQKLPPFPPGGPSVEVVESVSLGPRCALHLLQVDESAFVVATDPTGLRSITPLPDTFEQSLEQALDGPTG